MRLAQLLRISSAGLLLLLPVVIAVNPVSRALHINDDQVASYAPVAAILLVACGVAAVMVVTGRRTVRWSTLDTAVAVLTAAVVLATLVGLVARNPLGHLAGDAFQAGEFCGFYFASRVLPRSTTDLRALFAWTLLLAAIAVGIDLAMMAAQWNPNSALPRLAPDGSRALPALLVPVVVAMVLYTRGRAAAVLALLTFWFATWAVASLTRGLWAGDALALAVLAVIVVRDRARAGRRPLLLVAGLACLALAGAAMVATVQPPVAQGILARVVYTQQQLFAPTNAVQQRRQIEAGELAPEILASPVIGHGFGAIYSGQTGVSVAELVIGDRHFIHDAYLAMVFRMGLLGLLAYVVVVVRFFQTTRAALARGGPRSLLVGIACSYVALLAYSITSDSLLRHPFGLFAGAAMAGTVVFAQRRAARPLREVDPTPPSVDVLVVAHSQPALLWQTVSTAEESLSRAQVRGQVMVLDNVMSASLPELVETQFPRARLVRNARPAGYGENLNRLIELSTAKYVLALNDDVELPVDTVSVLVTAAEANPDLAAVGPRLVYADGTFQSAGERLPTVGFHVLRELGIGLLSPRSWRGRFGSIGTSPGADGVSDTGYLVGACMLMRRAALEQVGGFDANFVMYSEDADWCRRASQAHWRIAVLPRVSVVHHSRQSWGAFSAEERERSMFRYLSKHGTSRAALLLLQGLVLISHSGRIGLLAVAALVGGSRSDLRARIHHHRNIVRIALQR